jgi:hypothetical protein
VELKETTYSPSSWEGTTRAIKEALGIKCLTKEMAETIMKMYLSRVSVEEMIDKLKLEEENGR